MFPKNDVLNIMDNAILIGNIMTEDRAKVELASKSLLVLDNIDMVKLVTDSVKIDNFF